MNKAFLKNISILCAFYTIMHIIFYNLNIKIYHESLYYFWQYLDPSDLKSRLLESVFYMHSQPPLFNLYLGIVLKLFPNSYIFAFDFLFVLLGFFFYVLIYYFLLAFRIKKIFAFILSSLYVVSPSFLLLQKWLYYTFPVAFLVTATAFFIYWFLKTRKYLYLFTVFFCIACMTYMRSVFHFIYFLSVYFVALLICKDFKKVSLAAIIPFIFVFALFFKNYVLFGHFSSSTWLGMSMARTVMMDADQNDINKAIATRHMSSVSAQCSSNGYCGYQSIDKYPKIFLAIDPLKYKKYKDINVLAKPYKSKFVSTFPKEPNFNYLGYITLSDILLEDCKYFLFTHPKYFIKQASKSFYAFITIPTTQTNFFLNENKAKLRTYVSLWYHLVDGRIKKVNLFGTQRDYYIFLIFFVPFLLFYALWQFFSKHNSHLFEPAHKYTLLFSCLTFIYIILVVSCFEYGETKRMRFLVEPMLLLFFALFLQNTAYPRLKKLLGFLR